MHTKHHAAIPVDITLAKPTLYNRGVNILSESNLNDSIDYFNRYFNSSRVAISSGVRPCCSTVLIALSRE